jgi:hypothetical protein
MLCTRRPHYRYTPADLQWDDKAIGATLLLATMTGNSRYTAIVETFLTNWMPGGRCAMPIPPRERPIVWVATWGVPTPSWLLLLLHRLPQVV